MGEKSQHDEQAGAEQQVTDMYTEDWQERETSPLQMDGESQSLSGQKKKATNAKHRTVALLSGSWAHLFFWIMKLQRWKSSSYVEHYQHWVNVAQCR